LKLQSLAAGFKTYFYDKKIFKNNFLFFPACHPLAAWLNFCSTKVSGQSAYGF